MKNAKVIRHEKTGCKGLGIVEMSTSEQAQEAFQMIKDKEVYGCPLNVYNYVDSFITKKPRAEAFVMRD